MVIRSYKASGSVDHVQFTFHRYNSDHLFKQHIYCGQPDRHIYGSGEGLRDGIPEKCSFFVTDIHIS